MKKGLARMIRDWASRRQVLALMTGVLALGMFAGAVDAQEQKNKPEYFPLKLLAKPYEVPDMTVGKEDAPITIHEYASATCPHCADFHINEWPLIRKEYVETGKARFVFREFPLDQVALAAFMLARCASNNDPQKYHALLDTIFKTQREWAKNPREGLMKIMRMAGMTDKQFDACLKNEKLARAIMNGARNASRDFKVQSTPTFFINGRKVEGRRRIEEFRKIIDEELKRAGAGGAQAGAAQAGEMKAGEKPAADKARAQ